MSIEPSKHVITETDDGIEDLELISRAAYNSRSKRTLIEQNPHFKRSIIQSILK